MELTDALADIRTLCPTIASVTIDTHSTGLERAQRYGLSVFGGEGDWVHPNCRSSAATISAMGNTSANWSITGGGTGKVRQEHPELKFDWKQILRDVQKNPTVLPEQYIHAGEWLRHRFREGRMIATGKRWQRERTSCVMQADLIRLESSSGSFSPVTPGQLSMP